jgi:hypothetical protein
LHLVFALLLATAAPAADPPAPTGPVELKRLGGPNACSRRPLTSVADLQKVFAAKRAEFEAVLAQAGFPGHVPDLFAAIERGEVREVEFPVGGRIQWMALRKQGKPDLLRDGVWSGKKPFQAYELTLTSKDHRMKLIIPKECSNLAMIESVEIPPPTAAVSATPASDCISRPITIDASRSAVSTGKVASVEASVTGPDGKTDDLGSQTSGFRWTKSYVVPGKYTVTAVAVADSGRRSGAATTTFELKPCPPACVITLSTDDVYTREEFTVDVSASKPQVGEIKVVRVEVINKKGEVATTMELNAPFQTTTMLDKGGMYTFRAVAEDQYGQRSSNACEASLRVRPRKGLVTEWLAGTERRWRAGFPSDRSAPLLGAAGGLNYMVNRHFELASFFGVAFNTRDSENSSLFVDLEANYRPEWGFVGGGIGGWDINHSESDAVVGLLHVGFNINALTTGGNPVAFMVQGRCFLDKLDMLENNYVLWGGLRLHHHN